MPDNAQPQQLLHLVIGGELVDLEHVTFKNLDEVEIVGVYPELRHRLCGLEVQGAADRRQRADALLHRPSAPAARSGPRHKAVPLKRLLRDFLRSPLVQRTLGVLAAEYLRLVWLTNRFSYDPPDVYELVEPHQPAIFAFWHGQHFMTPFIKTKESYRAKVLISQASRRRVQCDCRRTARHRHHPGFRRPWRRVPSQGRRRRVPRDGAGAGRGLERRHHRRRAEALARGGHGPHHAGAGIRPADPALCHGDQPFHSIEKLGLHHHQSALRARRCGRY